MLIPSGSPLLAPSSSLDDAVRILARYRPATLDQVEVRDRMVAFARGHDAALTRACTPGHLTGSALVVDARGERALLLHHAKLGRWLQPGGHADGDGNLLHVAWREATEETGIAGLAIWSHPIDLDVHRVAPPGEAPHDHLDVRFLVVAPPGATAVGNHESTAMQWVTPHAVSGLNAEPGLHRLVTAGFAAFAAMEAVPESR